MNIAWSQGACCRNCMYELDQECHRHAPKRFAPDLKCAVWPKIKEDDWCGEWVLHPEETLPQSA